MFPAQFFFLNQVKKSSSYLQCKNLIRTSGQDGLVGRCYVCLLSWPHQNYNSTTITESHLILAEKKSYKWRHIEEATTRLEWGMEMQNGLVPHLHVVVKSWEKYLCCRGPPWRARGPSPTQDSPFQEENSPQFLAVKTRRNFRWVRQRTAEVTVVPLKGPACRLAQ